VNTGGAVHALLNHRHANGFTSVPKPLGLDDDGREVLTCLPGETAGTRTPWPGWVHDEQTLDQVARRLREYPDVAADFVPPPDAVRRGGRLTGFFDWDFAGPAGRDWDLAFTAFAWVPLNAVDAMAANGFTDLAARPRRRVRFLGAYGWTGDPVFRRLIGKGVLDELERARDTRHDLRF
jgi:hypothetical protein